MMPKVSAKGAQRTTTVDRKSKMHLRNKLDLDSGQWSLLLEAHLHPKLLHCLRSFGHILAARPISKSALATGSKFVNNLVKITIVEELPSGRSLGKVSG